MKAVRLYKPGDIRFEEVEIPKINANEVLINVKATGACGSDVPRAMETGAHIYPIILGHEFAGQVEEVGKKVKYIKKNDRVTAYPLLPCYQCEFCKVGMYNLCNNYSYIGSRENGSFAEYIKLPAENVLKLTNDIDYETGATTDPAAVALHGFRKAHLNPGDKVAIIGAGAIGLFALQWAKILGARQVLVIDLFDEKLKIAENLGADDLINANKRDVVKEVLDKTEGKGVDIVIESSGAKSSQAESLLIANKLGKIVFIGISHNSLQLNEKQVDNLLRKELNIIGSWNSINMSMSIDEWRTALHFMSIGQLRAKPLITHKFGFKDVKKAFEMMYDQSEIFIKVMFFPDF